MGAIPRDQFRAAMARFPGAVTIVTARTATGERRGITATAVCSVTADPPSVLVCLNQSTGTCAAVQETGRFAVNLLAEDEGALAMHFAGQGGVTGEDKFLNGTWQDDPLRLPILSSAMVALSCEVTSSVQTGTHRIFIGQISNLAHGDGAALIYEQSRFHRLSPL
jgi:flavin reductase (DIM6/NTAB) family NADH-FMN oxidoreductase RutF